MSICCICSQQCGKPHLSCDFCKLPMHIKCLDLSDTELRVLTSTKSIHLKVSCNKCRSVADSLAEIKSLMTEFQTSFDKRLKLLENSNMSGQLSAPQKEELIEECVDRSIRAANVIVFNVPESKDNNDVDQVNDVLEQIDPSAVACPDDVTRFGKSTQNKPRPIKITFRKTEMAKMVLRKSSTLKGTKFSNIIISNDRTPAQQEYYRNLKIELTERINNGENLTIKYLNKFLKLCRYQELPTTIVF